MESYVQEALDIVKAQASVRNMSEEEITSMVQRLSQQLKELLEERSEEDKSEQKQQEPPVDPKKAIREKSVICLECGKTFKVLTKRHLSTHGLTPAEYKEKWGYKKGTALIAKSLARERRKKMQEMQLWKRRKNV
ncbi:MAG: MucR family transcriptional regulator [Desulfohalobiaceae bacterium]